MEGEKESKKEAPRIFTVCAGKFSHVGPWSNGSVFTEADFKMVNAVPKESDAMVGKEYFNDLLNRLISLKAIEETPNAKPTERPESFRFRGMAIGESVRQAIEENKATPRGPLHLSPTVASAPSISE
jgi:hypothetical protein